MKSKLQDARIKKGFSQSQLAKASKVPIKTIQRFEQQPNQIDGTKLKTLCGLSSALDCTIGDIIEGAELKAKYDLCK